MVTFAISKPDTYTVMFNDSPERALHIFANPLEEDVPDPDDENAIYIGPGEWNMYKNDSEGGQTVYVAGGAVVHGRIIAENEENVTIRGRGIIDGSRVNGWKGRGPVVQLKINNCQNVIAKDLISLNANAWVCQCYNVDNMLINGIKIISARHNGDGIFVQSSPNFQVINGF